MESPCLVVFKTQLDTALGHLLWVALREQALEQQASEQQASRAPFQPQPVSDCLSQLNQNDFVKSSSMDANMTPFSFWITCTGSLSRRHK